MAIYFQGAGEQAHNFGDQKSKKNKEKPPFCLIFLKISSASGGTPL